MTLIGSFDIESSSSVSVECILDGGDILYCSEENLYLCSEVEKKILWLSNTWEEFRLWYLYVDKTAVLRFELASGKAILKSAGLINPAPLKQVQLFLFYYQLQHILI
ncbi:beta-propeller domain-containing protein [Caldicellulosiruptor acetigenus]|uniref:beta-propeller domain-containing protein n=1 Tax=Caldicellulosiruptor acetigenus TaxID=301953 RepID=UPI0011D0FAAA